MSWHNIIMFIIIILTIIAALFVSHYFIYKSIISFFKIAALNIRTTIAVTLFVLAVSYILASILAHWQENIFTIIYYFSASLWYGVLTNLLVVFSLVWLVVGFGKIFNFSIDLKFFGILAILIACIYVGYGIWNANHPRIKYITVKLKNLPDNWRGKTAVQISDLHLGHILGQDFLKRVITQINNINPEIVFITGDLFDGMDGNLGFHLEPFRDLKVPQGVYFITGNHETYFGTVKTYNILRKTKINILDDQLKDVAGLQLIGISYHEREEKKDLAAIISGLENFDRTKPSVLLYHSPVQIAKIQATGIDLMLAGHTHRGQIFPYNFITSLVYHGYDYGLKKNGKMIIYTTSGTGVWGPTMRTGNQPEIVVIKFE